MEADVQDKYNALLEWIRSTDGSSFVGPIAPHQFADTGRGIIALQDLHAGQVTLKISARLLMHTGSAAQSPPLQAALQGLAMSEEQVLALHLLHELHLGPTSHWAAYLAVLPSCYTTLPCFPATAVAMLQLPHAVDTAHRCLHSLQQSHARVVPVLKRLGIKDTAVHRWAWAQSTCASRTMYMETSTAGALTPLGDLHNYSPPPAPHVPELDGLCCAGQQTVAGCTWVPQWCQDPDASSTEHASGPDGTFDADAQAYCLVAPQRCRAGEQVMLCYGTYDNLQLLEHYGFVLDRNPHDRAQLLMTDGSSVWLHWNGVPTWESMRDLRLAALTPDQLPSAHLARCGERVCVENDLAALRALNAAARAALAALPTTLAQDVEQLAVMAGRVCNGTQGMVCFEGVEEASVEECELLALRWRVGYKRMLYWASQLCLL